MNLKNTRFILIVSMLFISSMSFSQLEISPTAGYFFGGKVNFYEGSLKLNDNADFGINLAFEVDEGSFIELSYVGSKSSAYWRPYGYLPNYPSQDFNINSNYFLIGALHQVPLGSQNVYGFGTFKLGAGYFNAIESRYSDYWRFSIGMGLGIKIFITERVGIRLGGNMYMPLYFNGVGAYVGIGTGGTSSGLSLNSTAVIVQGDFSGGLIFVLQ